MQRVCLSRESPGAASGGPFRCALGSRPNFFTFQISVPMWRKHSFLTLLVLPVAVAWERLILYDVLPSSCSAIDNHSFSLKDYGDAPGDAYYAMRSLLPPLLCETCHNTEPTPDSLCVRYNGISVGTCFSEQATPGVQVARKIQVEVPDRHEFGPYGACNPPEDATPGTMEMCEYGCSAASAIANQSIADGIGRERLIAHEANICSEAIGRSIVGEPNQTSDAIRALHYDYNLCRLLDGNWYSLGHERFAGQLWRNPRLVKAVDADCLMSTLHRTVRDAGGTGCFDSCPDAVNVHGVYNTSSLCYIRCFYETLLGPNADSSSYAGGGMGATAITRAWLAGFEECPEYDTGDAERDEAERAAELERDRRRRLLQPSGVLLPP